MGNKTLRSQRSDSRRAARSIPASGELPAAFRRPASCPQCSRVRRAARSVPASGELSAAFPRPASCPQRSHVRRAARSVPASGELPAAFWWPASWRSLHWWYWRLAISSTTAAAVCPLCLERRCEVRLEPRVERVMFLLDLIFCRTNPYPNGSRFQVRSSGPVGQTGPLAS
jgi:hypothetical protein